MRFWGLHPTIVGISLIWMIAAAAIPIRAEPSLSLSQSSIQVDANREFNVAVILTNPASPFEITGFNFYPVASADKVFELVERSYPEPLLSDPHSNPSLPLAISTDVIVDLGADWDGATSYNGASAVVVNFKFRVLPTAPSETYSITFAGPTEGTPAITTNDPQNPDIRNPSGTLTMSVVVPEPSQILLLLVGLAAVAVAAGIGQTDRIRNR